MGDASTHLIFCSGYWYLATDEEGTWVDVKDDHYPICKVGDEEKILALSEVK
jgi:hypothetical protein